MADTKLTASLQESCLTLLVLDDQHGAIAAGLIEPELFEPPYDDIAARALDYRARYRKAPGRAHIDDLFDHILGDPKNKKKRLYQQVLGSLLQTYDGMNPEYTLSRVSRFIQEQNFKTASIEAAELMERGADDALEQSYNIMDAALRFRPQTMDSGMFLSDKRAITFLTENTGCDYSLGIEYFDRHGIGPTRKEALGFLAPKGRGKTWFCTHAGVMALLQGAKVAHASLEMGNERMMPRYLRRLFAIAKHKEKYKRYILETDDLNRLIGFKNKLIRPELSLEDTDIEKRVAEKMDALGERLNRLVCKPFPTKSLSLSGLRAWLDNLERAHRFVPDVLILDYPKLMKMDGRQELRIALGTLMEELRGLCMERNIAGIFPMQANREGESSKILTGEQIGEDYSLGQTVDFLITYNQTRAEKEMNLARLYVDKSRSDKDGFEVLITQDYETGQFVKQSIYKPSDYWDILPKAKGQNDNTMVKRRKAV